MAVWALRLGALVLLALDRSSVGAKELQLPVTERFQLEQFNLLSPYWRNLAQELSTMVSDKCSEEYYSCLLNGTARKYVPCDYNITGLCELCRCDPSCLKYGDCCFDYAASAAVEGIDTHLKQDVPHYDCVSLDFRTPAGILMVRDCPSGYRGSEEERLCHQDVSSEEYFYLLDLPVTSSASNVTYVNYFCASCNGDAYSLVSWNVTINCSKKEISSLPVYTFMQDALYKPGMRQWDYNFTTTDKKVKLTTCFLQVLEFWNFLAFVERFGSRVCSHPKTSCEKRARGTSRCIEQVRNCDPTWDDLDVMDKCQQYSLLMHHDNVAYKNPHCAVCNYVNLTDADAACMKDTRSCKFCRIKLPPSFSALMDFNRNPCDGEYFYDPINKQCIPVKCGSLFTRQNRECVRKTDYSELSNSSVLNNACPKVVVTEDEFIILRDGSVYINSSKKVYRPGNYETLNDSQILICNEEFVYLSTVTRTQKWVTFAVLLLSLICLLAHIAIYMLLPKMRNLPGRNLFSLSCSLFLAHFLFLISTHATEHNNLCIFMGLSLHYFWLASFCWMNVMSLDVYITFRGNVRRGSQAGGKTFLLYSMYAWGVPLLVILSALCVQFTNILPEYKPKYAGQMCWINNRDSLVLFFLFPIGAIVLENVALFIVTSYGIYQQTKITKFAMKRSQSVQHKPDKEVSGGGKTSGGDVSVLNKQQKKTDRKERIRLLLYIKLGVIQGLTWTTGFLAAFTGLPACWYLFTILNGLQGFFIFLSFDMKKKVWESLQKQLTPKVLHSHPSKETRTTTLTASTSSGRNKSSKSQSLLSDSDGQYHTETSNLSGSYGATTFHSHDGANVPAGRPLHQPSMTKDDVAPRPSPPTVQLTEFQHHTKSYKKRSEAKKGIGMLEFPTLTRLFTRKENFEKWRALCSAPYEETELSVDEGTRTANDLFGECDHGVEEKTEYHPLGEKLQASSSRTRSTKSLLDHGGSACRNRGLGVTREDGKPAVADVTAVAAGKETDGDELEAPNSLKQGQGSMKCVLRWEDQHMKSCPMKVVHREKQNIPPWRQSLHGYHSNTSMPCYSDDTLHKVMDKSVQRSFEIQKILDLLQQIKETKGIEKDRPGTNSEMESAETLGNEKIQSSHQINHGHEGDESVMTRSRSLVARRSDVRRHMSPPFQTGHTSSQPATAFLKCRLTRQPSKTACMQTGSDDLQGKPEYSSCDHWPDLDDQSSVEQMSMHYTQEQVTKILASRLKRILLGYDTSHSCDDGSTHDEGQRGRCSSMTTKQASPSITGAKSQSGESTNLNNTVVSTLSNIAKTAAGEGVPQQVEWQEEHRMPDRDGGRCAGHFPNNIALESPV